MLICEVLRDLVRFVRPATLLKVTLLVTLKVTLLPEVTLSLLFINLALMTFFGWIFPLH